MTRIAAPDESLEAARVGGRFGTSSRRTPARTRESPRPRRRAPTINPIASKASWFARYRFRRVDVFPPPRQRNSRWGEVADHSMRTSNHPHPWNRFGPFRERPQAPSCRGGACRSSYYERGVKPRSTKKKEFSLRLAPAVKANRPALHCGRKRGRLKEANANPGLASCASVIWSMPTLPTLSKRSQLDCG